MDLFLSSLLLFFMFVLLLILPRYLFSILLTFDFSNILNILTLINWSFGNISWTKSISLLWHFYYKTIYRMSCDTYLKSDYECICSVCEKHEPLSKSTPVKVTRRRKKLQIEWISCNSCNKWVYPKCSGFSRKETLYFKNLSKQTKA